MLPNVRPGPKQLAQRAVRAAHLLVPRQLPDRIGIYFHDVPPSHLPTLTAALTHLAELGYGFGGPDHMYRPDGGKVCWVSFDDNYLTWLGTLGTLSDLRISATFFVSTSPIRDRSSVAERMGFARRIGRNHDDFDTMSSAEIGELVAAGHIVGSHSHSHLDLASLDPSEARGEILSSKQILEEVTAGPVVHFSYPYGTRRRFTEELRDYCMAIGFETISNGTPGMQYAGHRPHRLHRTLWNLERPIDYNLANLRVDGRWFERVTGRSPMSG